jgi:hypothetical protein
MLSFIDSEASLDKSEDSPPLVPEGKGKAPLQERGPRHARRIRAMGVSWLTRGAPTRHAGCLLPHRRPLLKYVPHAMLTLHAWTPRWTPTAFTSSRVGIIGAGGRGLRCIGHVLFHHSWPDSTSTVWPMTMSLQTVASPCNVFTAEAPATIPGPTSSRARHPAPLLQELRPEVRPVPQVAAAALSIAPLVPRMDEG